LVISGKPYLVRALLLVTSGGLFWIVALGPEKCAIRGLFLIAAALGRTVRSCPTTSSVGRWARALTRKKSALFPAYSMP
jgi:hypothetical protein